jgi:hypothetical protein
VAVERQIVGARDGADLRLVEPGEVSVGGRWVAAHEQQVPGEVGAGVGVGDLEDLSALVVVARVGRVGPRFAGRATLVVVGERDVHLAGLGIGLEVFGPVHFGGACLVGR